MSDAPARIRVVVAEDHEDLRFLIRDRLHRDGRFVVVGEASTGREAVEAATRHQPDLILLDVRMPVMSGLEAIPEIREASPGTRIVMLSGRPEQDFEASALELGADLFLEKELAIPTIPGLLVELVGEPDADHVPAGSPALAGLSTHDVLSLVIHELRAPMTVLRAVGERLEESIHRLDERQIRVLSNLLHSNIRRMDEILDSLRELRGPSGKEGRERTFAFDELVRKAVGEFQLVAEDREVTVTAAPVEVHGDPVRIRQVLDNLLQNAHRYGRGRIEVVVDEAGDDAEVRVRDHGPGIPPALRERMFERFARGDDERRDGMGLGLFLSREIVRAAGGTLTYEQPPDGPGACFVLRLPLES